MFFSLFNKNSRSIEKEMDEFIENEKEDKEVEKNKLVKSLEYLKFYIHKIC